MKKIIELTNKLCIEEKLLLDKISSYIFCETAQNADDDSYFIRFSDIEKNYHLPKNFINDIIAEKIRKNFLRKFKKQTIDFDFFSIKKLFVITLYNNYITEINQFNCIDN